MNTVSFVLFFVRSISAAKIYKLEFVLRTFEQSGLRTGDVMWYKYIKCLT